MFSPLQVNIYNPEWDFAKWSEYANLQGIELLYRRVGDSEWRNALDADSARIAFDTIVPEVCSLSCLMLLMLRVRLTMALLELSGILLD